MPRDATDLLHRTLDRLVLDGLAILPLHAVGLTLCIEQRRCDEVESA